MPETKRLASAIKTFKAAKWLHSLCSQGHAFVDIHSGVRVFVNSANDGKENPDAPQFPKDALKTAHYFPMHTPDTLIALSKLAQSEKTRYAIHTMEFEHYEHGLRVTATDGRKLASVAFGEVSGPNQKSQAHAQLFRFLTETLDKLAGRPRSFDVASIPEHCVLRFTGTYKGWGSVVLFPEMGQYPDWRAVRPRTKHVTVVPPDALGTIDQLQGCTAVESQAIRMEIEAGRWTLRAKAGHVASVAVLPLPAKAKQHKDHENTVIGISPVHVAEVADVLRTRGGDVDGLLFKYIDGDHGVLWESPAFPHDVYLNMPIDI